MSPLTVLHSACCRDPLIRRGWQHDGRDPINPAMPGIMPQKVPTIYGGAGRRACVILRRP